MFWCLINIFFIIGFQCLDSNSCQSNLNNDIYHCDDTHCISKSQVCNGIPNCLQAQDESISECGKTIYIIYY